MKLLVDNLKDTNIQTEGFILKKKNISTIKQLETFTPIHTTVAPIQNLVSFKSGGSCACDHGPVAIFLQFFCAVNCKLYTAVLNVKGLLNQGKSD